MLRYREYMSFNAQRSTRIWTAFAKALVFAIRPMFRVLCRVVPPLGRAVRKNVDFATAPGLMRSLGLEKPASPSVTAP